MKRKIIILLSILMVALSLAGCSELETYNDTDTPRLDVSLADSKLEKTHIIGEQLTVTTNYTTENYDTKQWLITDNKTINMNLIVTNMPEGTEVFVEHVHADVAIASTDMELNGIIQDSMDDTFHGNGTNQPGWFVNANHAYKETFSIEGYSQLLIESFGFYLGGYGYNSTSTSRMTESRLKSHGAYGNQLVIVYNLAVKYPGEDYYHSETIFDKFIIHSTPAVDTDAKDIKYPDDTETQIVVALNKARDEGKHSWITTNENYIKFLNDNKSRLQDAGYEVTADGKVEW